MNRRVLVLGLDGMPRSLLLELARDGVVPRLAALLAAGGDCAPLRAPVPEVSSTSWATFLTGTNPGRHGVYGFTDLIPDSYRLYFTDANSLCEPPLWEHAAKAGKETLCLNVPGTYPAPPIRGTLVSGFVAPRLDRSVHPPELAETLRAFGYELDVEVGTPDADPVGFLGRARRALAARTAAFEHLLARGGWDLAVAVLTETDRVQHHLWRHLADGDPLRPAMLDFYTLVDECAGRLMDQAGPGDGLFILSDHGFGPAECQFYVNAWLRTGGWLGGGDEVTEPGALDGRTTAFALDPARVYLHRRTRYPLGGLADEAAADLAEEIRAGLLALRRDGDHVAPDADGPALLDAVLRRDEVYSGPMLDLAPDLVAVPAHGVQLRGAWAPGPLVRPGVLTGTHTRGNAVFYSSDPLPDGIGEVEMADVAPTVLHALAVRPDGLDGRVLTTAGTRQNPSENFGEPR